MPSRRRPFVGNGVVFMQKEHSLAGLKTTNKDSLIFKVTLYMCSLIPYRIFIFHGINDSKGRVIFFVSDYSDKNSKLKSRVSNEHRVHKMIL